MGGDSVSGGEEGGWGMEASGRRGEKRETC